MLLARQEFELSLNSVILLWILDLTIVRIPGDGVGPELVAAASQLAEAVHGPICWVYKPGGLSALQSHGSTAPPTTLDALRRYKLAVKGPFRTPNGGTIKSGNFILRRNLLLFACLRPLPINPERPVLLVRENVEDLYGATEWMPTPDVVLALKVASVRGSRRIAQYAFELARSEGRERVTALPSYIKRTTSSSLKGCLSAPHLKLQAISQIYRQMR